MLKLKKESTDWEHLAAIGIALLASVIVFAANFSIRGPMVQPDEGSYLANAAALAGFPNDLAGSFHAGYSMLIVPAFWLADSPHGIWTAVKSINALLFFATVVCLWMVSKQLGSPLDTPYKRLEAVTLASIYPMWVVMVGYSFAQIAFVPFFLLTLLAYLRAIEGGIGKWVTLGITVGFLYWVHPTALAPITAVSIGAGYVAWNRRWLGAFFVLILTITLMLFAYKSIVTPWLYGKMTISGLDPHLHYPPLSQVFAPLMKTEGLKAVLERIAGHFFYLSIGTVGLIWVGLFSLAKQAFLESKASDNLKIQARAVAVLLCLVPAGMVMESVLNLLTTTPYWEVPDLDFWMYGRYVEGVIAPILLVGAMSTSFPKQLWVSMLIAVLCAVLLSMGLEEYGPYTGRNNVTAFWQDFWLHDDGVWAWLASGSVLMILVALSPRRVGFVLIASVFLYSSYLQINWHRAATESESIENRWSAAKPVRDQFAAGTCIGFDHSGIDSYDKHVYWYDVGFFLFDFRLQRIAFDKWLESCDGPLFSFDTNLDERGAEVHPISISSIGGPVLWVKGRQLGEEIYPMSLSNPSIALSHTIGAGWHGLEQSHVWSGAHASLKLAVPDNCDLVQCAVIITMSAYGASETRPVKVIFQNKAPEAIAPQSAWIRDSNNYRVIISLSPTAVTQIVDIDVPQAVSPSELEGSSDTRVLGVALKSIELMRADHPPVEIHDGGGEIIIQDLNNSSILNSAQ